MFDRKQLSDRAALDQTAHSLLWLCDGFILSDVDTLSLCPIRAFPPVAMETSSNGSKHGKDLDQPQHLTAEEAELTEPSSHWAAEPNFNLRLASPRNPRQAAETFKLHGATESSGAARGGGKPGGKGAVTAKTGRSASALTTTVMSQGERENPSWQKSKIPSLSRSSEEASLTSRGEHRLKSPTAKSTPTLVHTNSKTTATPKLQPPPPPPAAGSPRTTNREKTQVGLESALRPKPAGATSRSPHLQTHRKTDGGRATSQNSPKTLLPPVSPRAQNQGPDSKPANRSPAGAAKSQREPGSTGPDEKAGLGSEAPPVGSRLQTRLSTRTPQPSSLSPRPSTQRQTSGPSSRHAAGSNGNLDSKDSSSGSGVPPSSKPGPTCSAFNPSQVGPVSPSPPRTGTGSKDNKQKTRAKSGPDLVSSRPSSAKRSPGSGPAKRFLGLTSEVQSSGSAPGKSSHSEPRTKRVDVSILFQIFVSCRQVLVLWLLWPPPAPKPEPASAPQQSQRRRDLSLGRERPHGG